MNRVPLLLMCLLAAGGCRHFPEVQQPIDPLPHDPWTEPAPPPELLEQVQALKEQTAAMHRRQDQMDGVLLARNDELQRTRIDHQRALTEIAEVRRQLTRWRADLSELQARLAEQDEQRITVLSELADRITDVSRAIDR